jgi:uncharacterized membrane protein
MNLEDLKNLILAQKEQGDKLDDICAWLLEKHNLDIPKKRLSERISRWKKEINPEIAETVEKETWKNDIDQVLEEYEDDTSEQDLLNDTGEKKPIPPEPEAAAIPEKTETVEKTEVPSGQAFDLEKISEKLSKNARRDFEILKKSFESMSESLTHVKAQNIELVKRLKVDTDDREAIRNELLPKLKTEELEKQITEAIAPVVADTAVWYRNQATNTAKEVKGLIEDERAAVHAISQSADELIRRTQVIEKLHFAKFYTFIFGVAIAAFAVGYSAGGKPDLLSKNGVHTEDTPTHIILRFPAAQKIRAIEGGQYTQTIAINKPGLK